MLKWIEWSQAGILVIFKLLDFVVLSSGVICDKLLYIFVLKWIEWLQASKLVIFKLLDFVTLSCYKRFYGINESAWNKLK